MKLHALVLAPAFALGVLSSAAEAAIVYATDAYYTYEGSVSSNTTRLLADKATVIGFPGRDTISYLLFDVGAFGSTSLASRGLTATLELTHDQALAGSLIPASDARPVSIGAYALSAPWDPVAGNDGDIAYGVDGSSAIATALVGGSGVYRWDITSLVDDWIEGLFSTTALALSGVYGNVNADDRNSYAAFHTVGADAAAPRISIAPIPLPAPFMLMVGGLMAFGFVGRRTPTPA